MRGRMVRIPHQGGESDVMRCLASCKRRSCVHTARRRAVHTQSRGHPRRLTSAELSRKMDKHRRCSLPCWRPEYRKGSSGEATEAWLCALTAFEVARRLADEDDPQSGDVSVKIEAGIQRFGSLEQKVERVQIACCDQSEFLAYYVPAGDPDLCAPAVICISREEETGATLLGRLFIGRGTSVLVVSHDDVSNHWRGQSETLLSCCLDYLSGRPEVDATRIGVYGKGLSAALGACPYNGLRIKRGGF